MKRFMLLILSLILILSMSGCAKTKETNVTGAWYSDMYTNVLTMDIDEGGIYTMELMDEAMIGTWVLEDNILYLDKGTAGEKTLNYDADAQTLEQNGFSLTRKKVKAFKPGKTINADIEAFSGSWIATKADLSDAALPLNPAGFYMNAVIDDAHVILTETDDKVVKEGEAVFADGALRLTVPAANESGNDSVYTITMLKSGMISIDDGSTVFYLEKSTPET